MLITNFSAGELSKTLFGRTDLPQYYSGAAKMENFDVIPTGGLKRRCGIERLSKLVGSGKIVPFVINRDLCFLLYLTPMEIIIYRLERGSLSEEEPQVYASNYTMDEIADVQYAQNFNTMVLCHENHPPLEVKLENENIILELLEIDISVDFVTGEKITDEDKTAYPSMDKQYESKGWLKKEGYYPSAVCFYNGRLVFASAKNYRQRLFFSAIKKSDKPYNFSTYKLYLTEKREYTTVFGQIDKDDTSIITGVTLADSSYIINHFTKPAEEYYTDSQLYPSDTRIESISLNRLKLTRGMIEPGLIFDINLIKGEIQAKIDAYGNKDDFPSEFIIYERNWRITYHDAYLDITYEMRGEHTVKCFVKASSMQVKHLYKEYQRYGNGSGWTTVVDDTWIKTISIENARKIIENNAQTKNSISEEIINKINEYVSTAKNYSRPNHHSSNSWSFYDLEVDSSHNKTPSIQVLYNNLLLTMYYELSVPSGTEIFYDYPGGLMSRVMARIINTDNAYIAVYTREIIADEYPTPDCGFTFEIASDTNDSIRWLALNKGLIVGTETSEWIIPPDVHATNIQAKLNSRYGSDKIQGTAVGDAIIFFQTGKKSLVEYYIPQQDNNFRANNMAMLAMQMLSENPAREFDYITSPYAKLLITRDNGTMATLLYERSTGTFAWGRITTGEVIRDTITPEEVESARQYKERNRDNGQFHDYKPFVPPKKLVRTVEGKIKSVAVLPGADGNDDAYLIVERNEEFWLERLRENCEVYLDSWTKIDKTAPWVAQREAYTGECVKLCRVFRDEDGALKYEALDADAAPDLNKDGDFYIGYSYTSAVRTMPALANNQMKKNNIVNILFRFLESYMPKITSFAGGRKGDTNTVGSGNEPYTGIVKAPFPGTWNEDVQAEISADVPAPIVMLALNAEVLGGQ